MGNSVVVFDFDDTILDGNKKCMKLKDKENLFD